jgi:hypothetical protein
MRLFARGLCGERLAPTALATSPWQRLEATRPCPGRTAEQAGLHTLDSGAWGMLS